MSLKEALTRKEGSREVAVVYGIDGQAANRGRETSIDMEWYDPHNGKWSSVGERRDSRSGHGIVGLRGCI